MWSHLTSEDYHCDGNIDSKNRGTEGQTTNSVLTRPGVRVAAGGGGGGGGGGGTEIARSCWHRSDPRVNTSKDNTG